LIITYIAFGAIAAIGILFFIVFVGPSFNRLYFQENPPGVTASNNNTSQGNSTSSSTISLTVDKINFNKTSDNTANMQISFGIHNTAHNTAILETIQYGVYMDGSKIVSGAIGTKSDDVIRGQGGMFQVLGENSLSLKDIQTIRKSGIGENNWNRIQSGNELDYSVRGIYSIRDNSDLQAAGTDRDFELSYHYSPNSITSSHNPTSGSITPLKLVQTIPLTNIQGRIDHMAIDSKNQRLFIAEIENNSVDVIDLKSGQRIRTIEGLSEPQGIVYDPSKNTIVVANGGDGSVRVFDGNSFAPTTTMALGEDADNMRYDNEKGLLYVGYGSGAVAIVNTGAANSNTRPIKDINLGGHPEAFQIDNSDNRIFVNVPAKNSIIVADTNKGEVIANWTPSGSQNYPMAIDQSDHRLFVGTRDPAKLIVINTDTGKEVASFDTIKDVDDISYDSANKQIYVSGGEGFVEVFKQHDADQYNSVSKIPTTSGARTSLFVPELKELFVAVPNHDNGKGAALWIYSVNP
jgi:YVTN family beta-propeller protein